MSNGPKETGVQGMTLLVAMSLVSVGESFTSVAYPGPFVPHEIQLEGGRVRKRNLALKLDAKSAPWYWDGGQRTGRSRRFPNSNAGDSSQEMGNGRNNRKDRSEAFLAWAKRSALPLPVSHEEPLKDEVKAALDRMLEGKRFVFLGEPDHFIIEKYPFRLVLMQYLFQRGWRHAAMETGRSEGWHMDRYLETGDTSYLSNLGAEPPSPADLASHDKTVEFIDAHEESFHQQLRQISGSRAPGTPRLHYWAYDLDIGVPLASIRPIQGLLNGLTGSQVQELRSVLDRLRGLSTDEQLARIATLQSNLPADADLRAAGAFGELRSWLAFLHDSVAAEKRPRVNQDPRGARRWWAQREHFLMQSLDAIVDGLSGDDELILLGHNVHLSKDAATLDFHPQFSSFWGWRSWLGAWGYRMYLKLAGWPTNMGDSVGTHLQRRFPGQVLSVWMVYGQGSLMTSKGPRTVRLRDDTVESLLARVGDRFLLPLNDLDPQAKTILSHANVRLMGGRLRLDRSHGPGGRALLCQGGARRMRVGSARERR
jgi:erythromycin esterase-like protein